MTKTRTRLSVLAAFPLLFVLATGAGAQGLADEATGSSGPPAWAYSMAHDLMSPFCPGRTLSACPSPQADQLRQWILFQAAAGQTQAEIEEILYERFGDQILSAPKAEGGWGISAYALPVVGFLLGGVFVVFMIRRLAMGRGPSETESTPTPLRTATVAGPSVSDAELERLVDEEFERS